MTLAPGTALGRYQILEPLGSGGMATVYKAYEPSLDRVVALKVIRQGFAEDADFAARFRREAQAVAKLDHPNIVHVHAFDESEGRLYLAMQYLDGGTLKDRLAELEPGSLLPPAQVASIVVQVADALSHAHGLGIVHRDIKPSNVMLTGSGRAVVTDFGIARMVTAAALTQTGVGVGTPEYMAPEQGAGAKVDARADIYSLGVVAYELLTGRVPYLADTPFAVVAAHMRDPLPLPSALNPAVPAGAERALLKALAKDPAQRFATATEFAAALSDGLRGARGATAVPTLVPTAASAKPDTRGFTFSLPALPRSRPALLAIAAAVLVVIGSTGAVISGAFRTNEVAPPAAPAAALAAAASGGPASTAAAQTGAPVVARTAAPTAGGTSTQQPLSAGVAAQAAASASQSTSPIAPTTSPAAPATVPAAGPVATLPPPTLAPTPVPTPTPFDPNAPKVIVSGRVTSGVNGAPLGGVQVQYGLATGCCVRGSANSPTDANGSYTLGVPAGAYKIWFNPQGTGSGYAPVYYGGATDYGHAQVVTVGTTPVSGIDVALRPGFLVSGRAVAQGGGNPPTRPKFDVGLGGDIFGNNWVGFGFGDTTGNYGIRLPAGTYSIWVWRDDRLSGDPFVRYSSLTISSDTTLDTAVMPP